MGLTTLFSRGGNWGKLMDKIKSSFMLTWLRSLQIWPIYDTVLYAYVPVTHRPLFNTFMSILWGGYLSSISQPEAEEALMHDNIESTDINGYINPTPTSVNQQTVGGVNFSWTTLDGSTNARWKISNPANSFSLVESVMAPGLDTVTTITRTITTSTTTESTSTFGQ